MFNQFKFIFVMIISVSMDSLVLKAEHTHTHTQKERERERETPSLSLSLQCNVMKTSAGFCLTFLVWVCLLLAKGRRASQRAAQCGEGREKIS